MIIRKASHTDNAQLLELSRNSGMKAYISLRIERNPDFFSLLNKRGENTTFIAEQNNKIIGCYSVSKNIVLIHKKKCSVYYVNDLKIDKEHRGGLVGFRLLEKMQKYLTDCNADLVMCVIAKGNTLMKPFLVGRMGIPASQSIGYFNIFQLFPSKQLKKKLYPVVVSELTTEHIKLFNLFQENYQLGKAINHHSNNTEQVFTIRNSTGIIASISMIDNSSLKQIVLCGVNPLLKCFLYLVKRFGLSIPKIGEAIRMLHINNIYYKPGHEEAFNLLLKTAKFHANKGNYHFVSLGVHSKDPINKLLKRHRKITFHSQGYIVSLKKNQLLIDEIINGIPFEDYSLV